MAGVSLKTAPIGSVTERLRIPARFQVCWDIIGDAERITEQSESCLMTISALDFRAVFPGRILVDSKKSDKSNSLGSAFAIEGKADILFEYGKYLGYGACTVIGRGS